MIRKFPSAVIVKIAVVLVVSLVLIVLINTQLKLAAITGFLFLVVPLIIIALFFLNKVIESKGLTGEKKVVIIIIFLFPLLPSLWGINIGIVLGAQRLSILALMMYLIWKRLYGTYILKYFRTNIFSYPIFFVLISMLVSSVLSEQPGKSLNFTISFFLQSVILAIVVFNVFTTREEIDKLLSAIMLSTLILSGLGLYESVTSYNVYSVFGSYDSSLYGTFMHTMRGGEIRIFASFSHSIAFGCFLSLALFTVLIKFHNSFIKFALSLGIVGLTILRTQSRTAQISMMIILGVYFFFIEKRKILALLAVCFPLLIFNMGTILYQFKVLNPFAEVDETLVSSSMARVAQFNFLIEYIKKNILLGVGMVNVPAMMRWIGNYHSTIDNFYLLYTWYFGLVGLFAWIVLMLTILIKPFFTFGKKIIKDKLALLLVANTFAFCIINIVVALWAFHFIFWISLGILTRLIYNHKVLKTKDEKK